MNKTFVALIGLTLAGIASAKLPPLSDDAKAAAAEAKAKTAWSAKVAGYKLCLAQNKVVEHYRKNKPAPTQPPVTTAGAAAVPGSSAAAASQPAVAAAGAQASAALATAASPATPAIPACQDPGPYVAMQEAAKVGVADALPVPAAGKPQPATPAKK